MTLAKVTEGISYTIISVENTILFARRLAYKAEFKDNSLARGQIASLNSALEYSEKLLKQLFVKAAAYKLKHERILPEKE